MSPWLWVLFAVVVALVLVQGRRELRRIDRRYQKQRQRRKTERAAMLERHTREDEEMERWIAEIRETL